MPNSRLGKNTTCIMVYLSIKEKEKVCSVAGDVPVSKFVRRILLENLTNKLKASREENPKSER